LLRGHLQLAVVHIISLGVINSVFATSRLALALRRDKAFGDLRSLLVGLQHIIVSFGDLLCAEVIVIFLLI
jgi:hypothetical protein